MPLAEEGKVVVCIEANAQVTHVISLLPDAARQLVVGLLEALDVVGLSDDGWPFDGPTDVMSDGRRRSGPPGPPPLGQCRFCGYLRR